MRRILVIAAVGAIVLAACGNSDTDSTTTSPVASPPSEVVIDNFQFGPPTIKISVGDTVKWENAQGAAHTVRSTGDGGIASDLIQPDGSFSFTFTEAGTFSYQCTIHPSMLGEVLVSP